MFWEVIFQICTIAKMKLAQKKNPKQWWEHGQFLFVQPLVHTGQYGPFRRPKLKPTQLFRLERQDREWKHCESMKTAHGRLHGRSSIWAELKRDIKVGKEGISKIVNHIREVLNAKYRIYLVIRNIQIAKAESSWEKGRKLKRGASLWRNLNAC